MKYSVQVRVTMPVASKKVTVTLSGSGLLPAIIKPRRAFPHSLVIDGNDTGFVTSTHSRDVDTGFVTLSQ